jgi:hypothetical protein
MEDFVASGKMMLVTGCDAVAFKTSGLLYVENVQ